MSHAGSAMMALAAATLVVGCGGGQSGPTGSSHTTEVTTAAAVTQSAAGQGTPLTRNDLIVKADAACRLISTQRNLIRIKTAADFQLAMPRLVVFQQTLVSDLHKLNPPASLRSDWNQFVGSAEKLANVAVEVNHLTLANNVSAVRRQLAIFANVRLQLRSAAKRDGLKDCAQY
jgi:hypothetical protein